MTVTCIICNKEEPTLGSALCEKCHALSSKLPTKERKKQEARPPSRQNYIPPRG